MSVISYSSKLYEPVAIRHGFFGIWKSYIRTQRTTQITNFYNNFLVPNRRKFFTIQLYQNQEFVLIHKRVHTFALSITFENEISYNYRITTTIKEYSYNVTLAILFDLFFYFRSIYLWNDLNDKPFIIVFHLIIAVHSIKSASSNYNLSIVFSKIKSL